MYQNNIYVAAALQLIEQNGNTTSLAVKNFIREKFPNFYCVQQEVSENLIDAEKDGIIDLIEDNGTYRTYGVKLFTKLPLDELIDALDNRIGETVTMDFRKKGVNKLGVVGVLSYQDSTHFFYEKPITNKEKKFKSKNLLAFTHNNKTFTL